MKIEVGTEYCTHDGRKARIYSTDNGKNVCSIHGAIWCSENVLWSALSWYTGGFYYESGSLCNSNIVSIWKEPVKPIDKSVILESIATTLELTLDTDFKLKQIADLIRKLK